MPIIITNLNSEISSSSSNFSCNFIFILFSVLLFFARSVRTAAVITFFCHPNALKSRASHTNVCVCVEGGGLY